MCRCHQVVTVRTGDHIVLMKPVIRTDPGRTPCVCRCFFHIEGATSSVQSCTIHFILSCLSGFPPPDFIWLCRLSGGDAGDTLNLEEVSSAVGNW